MSQIIDRLVRENIKSMKAYASARSTAKAMDNLLLLDAAENPWSPFEDGAECFHNLNLYPEPQPADLLRKFSGLYGVPADNILITRGSEEAIRLLLQTFCDPRKDAIITCPPTFAMYPIEAQIHDITNIKIPRTGDLADRLSVDQVVKTATDQTQHVKIVFICNPGNPSSTSLPVEEVKTLIRELSDCAMVVIDEAYIEFADHPSFATLLSGHPNLIILRTLSKSYGLAGLRCGCVLAHEQVIASMKKIIAAYPVPRPTQVIAAKALSTEAIERMKGRQGDLKRERDRMVEALKDCPGIKRIYPSTTNFLCVEVPDVQKCLKVFRDLNILIRDRSAAIPHAVNIAVGPREQNDRVIKILEGLEG